MALFGMIGGPQLGLFFLGILYPCANKIGAYAGFFSGLLFSFWLGVGAQIYKSPVHMAPFSTEKCHTYNITNSTTSVMTSTLTSAFTAATTAVPVKELRIANGLRDLN